MAWGAGQSARGRTCEKCDPLLAVGDIDMLSKIDVQAGNWVRFHVGLQERKLAWVWYHPTRENLECSCRAKYDPGNPCPHVVWLAKEFTYDNTFEDIRKLILKEAGVDYSYTVIEDLWDKCLKVTNVRLYDSFKQGVKQGVKPVRNPEKFKLEREGSFGVDTSTKKDRTPLGWQGKIRLSDQDWIVEQYEENIFLVRLLPMSKQDDIPWRIVERIGADTWKSNCACSEERACVHELAAKTALSAWIRNGLIQSSKKTDETQGLYITAQAFTSMVESAKKINFENPFLKPMDFEIEDKGITEKWRFTMTDWGTLPTARSVAPYPYIAEERSSPPEETKPPAKPKNRFSRIDR